MGDFELSTKGCLDISTFFYYGIYKWIKARELRQKYKSVAEQRECKIGKMGKIAFNKCWLRVELVHK